MMGTPNAWPCAWVPVEAPWSHDHWSNPKARSYCTAQCLYCRQYKTLIFKLGDSSEAIALHCYRTREFYPFTWTDAPECTQKGRISLGGQRSPASLLSGGSHG